MLGKMSGILKQQTIKGNFLNAALCSFGYTLQKENNNRQKTNMITQHQRDALRLPLSVGSQAVSASIHDTNQRKANANILNDLRIIAKNLSTINKK
jgi:hypothetical protein